MNDIMINSIRRFVSTLRRATYWLLARLLVLSSKVGLFTAYQPVPQIGLHIAPNREQGVLARWEAIRNELPPARGSVLDIGCNVGFYVASTAQQGHFAIGIDSIEYTSVFSTIKEAIHLKNAAAAEMRLGPDNAHTLPEFDVVIALQVFHHFCATYGANAASRMLETVWARTRQKLIIEIEPSGRAKEPFRSRMPEMGNDSEAWIREFFGGLGCAEVREIYRDEGHKRSVFVVSRHSTEPRDPGGVGR